ncbi:MAG: ABC transporter ATP-binding protein [Rhodospirillales bacterium]
MSEAIVTLAGLSLFVGERALLRAIDLRLAKGEVLGLGGPSGAGKSTLLRFLAGHPGLQRQPFHHRGRIERAAGVTAFLDQDPRAAFNPALSLATQLFEAAEKASGTDPDEGRAALFQALEALFEPASHDRLLNSLPAALSGGELQRLGFVMAWARVPQLLILDEPWSALDGASRGRLSALVDAAVKRRGLTVVVASHEEAPLTVRADRRLHMTEGRLGPREVQPLPPEISPPAAVGEPVLAVRGLSKSWGGRPLFQDVEMTLRAGDWLAVTGLSGAGKSTLARIILGLEKADAGSVRLLGREVSALPLTARDKALRQSVQMVFQNPDSSLNPAIPAGRQVARALDVGGRGSQKADIAQQFRRFNLPPDLMGRVPPALSGGQRQRLAFALAVAGGPDLLIADEAFSALDGATRNVVIESLNSMSPRPAMLLITHDQNLASALCSRRLTLG